MGGQVGMLIFVFIIYYIDSFKDNSVFLLVFGVFLWWVNIRIYIEYL